MSLIGSWDTTNLKYALVPAMLKNGSNPANFNTGTAYPFIGSQTGFTATLTNMIAGFGYNNGKFVFDGGNDKIVSNYQPAFSATGKKTWEVWFTMDVTGASMAFFSQSVDPDNRFFILVSSAGTTLIDFELANDRDRHSGSTGITSAATQYYLVVVKDTTAMRTYVNGANTSEEFSLYGHGDMSLAADLEFGMRGDGAAPVNGSIEHLAEYDEAWDLTRVQTEYALGPDKGGLIATIDGNNSIVGEPSASTTSDPFAKTPFSRNAFRSGRFQRGAFR